jgi:TRAP-type C4-dicarboxylate transport system substrate-binding protein|tara:strand:- start:249 stop:1190 length:942 start_codon:yes stop_codon:yes gene_type:complete
MKNIKWLIAHQPEYLFLRTAKAFAKMLEEVAPQYKIEILTTEQYRDQYDADFTRDKILDLVKNNDVQMSQTEVWELGQSTADKNFFAFDMPFLFKSHAHARRVLEGPIGTTINKRLGWKTGVRGLAYTYSGGYRTIGSDTSIKSLADLNSKTIRVNGNPITKEFWASMGVSISRGSQGKRVNDDDVTSDLTLPEGIDGKDTTYIRFQNAKNFLKSEHSLFLTDILVSEKFFNELSEKDQSLFLEAAHKAARLERKWSQEDADKFEATAKERGCEISELSDEDKNLMQEKAKPLYDKWSKEFFPGLLQGINKLQ